jgi:DNA-binding transcriptional ArsR family regulator
MPRARTTTDAFNAVAEPRRRQIVDLLARRGALSVGALVVAVGLPQPAVSKHLGVLRTVGILAVSKEGRHRVYRLDPQKLKPVYDWIKSFEHFWGHHLGRIKDRAERQTRK